MLSQSPFIIYELLLLNEINVEYQSLVNINDELRTNLDNSTTIRSNQAKKNRTSVNI